MMLLDQMFIRTRKSIQEKLNTKKMERTYSSIFHYDENSKTWRCFDRSDWRTFWNNRKSMLIGKGKTPEEAHRNLKELAYEKN